MNPQYLPSNVEIGLSQPAQTFVILSRMLAAVFIAAMGFVFRHANGSCRGALCGVMSAHSMGIVFFIFSVAIVLSGVLYGQFFSFKFSDTDIVINSGVLFRDSMMINFDKIQDVEIFRGPLHMILGVSSFKIWTASQGQFSGRSSRPAGAIVLSKEDALWLQEFIQQARARKSSS